MNLYKSNYFINITFSSITTISRAYQIKEKHFSSNDIIQQKRNDYHKKQSDTTQYKQILSIDPSPLWHYSVRFVIYNQYHL